MRLISKVGIIYLKVVFLMVLIQLFSGCCGILTRYFMFVLLILILRMLTE